MRIGLEEGGRGGNFLVAAAKSELRLACDWWLKWRCQNSDLGVQTAAGPRGLLYGLICPTKASVLLTTMISMRY